MPPHNNLHNNFNNNGLSLVSVIQSVGSYTPTVSYSINMHTPGPFVNLLHGFHKAILIKYMGILPFRTFGTLTGPGAHFFYIEGLKMVVRNNISKFHRKISIFTLYNDLS